MRKNNGMLLSIITVMVLGFGLFLPRIASLLQNRHTDALAQRYPVKTIQLETITPVDVFKLLKLMSGEHTSIALETGGVLTRQLAHQLALEAVAFIEESVMDLRMERYTGYQQTPILVFTEDAADAAVLWQCEFIDESLGSSMVMFLDDETGKMISFQYTMERTEQPTNVSPIDLTAEKWADMCVEYYGFQSVQSEMYSSNERTQNYNLTFTADDGNVLILPFRIAYVSSTAVSVKVAGSKYYEIDQLRRVIYFN